MYNFKVLNEKMAIFDKILVSGANVFFLIMLMRVRNEKKINTIVYV